MARFGIVGPTYQSESVNADAQRTINWYPETIESGDGVSALALYPSPGMQPFTGSSRIVSTEGMNGPPAGTGRPELHVTFTSMPFVVGQTIHFAGLTTETWLNGQTAVIENITGNMIDSPSGTWETVGTAPAWPYGPTADTGTGLALAGSRNRGLYEFNKREFTVTDTLYEVQADGTSIPSGLAVFPDDGLPATMEANSAQQLLVCAGGVLNLYPLVPYTSNAIATLASFPAIPQLRQPAYLQIVSSTNFPAYPANTTLYLNGLTTETELNDVAVQVRGTSGTFLTVLTPPGFTKTFPSQAETGAVETAVAGPVGTNPPANLPPIQSIAFVDGYFLALGQNSATVYYSGLEDGTSWDLASAFVVSQYSDNVLAMMVNFREIWLFGEKRTLVYYDSGDPLVPFQPVPGAFIEHGIIAPWSAARLENSVFWLGSDERGVAVAWRTNGYTPVRISNHCVEREWQEYPTISDAVAYSFQDRGHSFWHINFPTAGKSWRYDATTNMWHEVATLKEDGTFGIHRSYCHAMGFGKHLIGDNQSCNILQMDKSFLTDTLPASVPSAIRRVRRAPHVMQEHDFVWHHKMRVLLETGLGPTPPLPGTAVGVLSLEFQDTNGIYWQASIDDAGSVATAQYGPGGPFPLYILVDIGEYPYTVTCYTLGMTTTGQLYLIPPPAPPALPIVSGFTKRILMMTLPSGLQTNLSVQYGQLVIEPPMQPYREPQVMLRWSDDGGHTWSNEYICGAGMAGDFKKRVEWRRLGRSRARVYEISVSDPIPWRIVDAYLFATPGFEPVERYVKQLGKMA